MGHRKRKENRVIRFREHEQSGVLHNAVPGHVSYWGN